MPIEFALTGAPLREENGKVYRPGKYFEIGKKFTDRAGIDFEITPAEAPALVAGYKSQPLNIEHEPSVLDGLLGDVDSLWIEGNDIMALYALPKWLHDATEGKEIKVSSEWDIATKKPGGAALVLNPALKDAAIQAAFSANPEAEKQRDEAVKALFERHDTPTGQMSMQDVHDVTARAGAICDKKNTGDKAKMAARHEMTALQAMHDMAIEHGAVCASGGHPYRSMSMFSEKPTDLQPGDKNMPDKTPWYSKLIAPFSKAGVPEADIHAAFSEIPAPGAQLSDTDTARFAALEADNAKLRAEFAEKDAKTFLETLKQRGQIMPFEEPGILAQFAQAAADDQKSGGKVKFSKLDDDMKPVDTEGSRVEMLKANLSMRPTSGMTQELTGHGRALGEGDLRALFSRSTAAETVDEKKARIDKQVAEERAAHGLPKK